MDALGLVNGQVLLSSSESLYTASLKIADAEKALPGKISFKKIGNEIFDFGEAIGKIDGSAVITISNQIYEASVALGKANEVIPPPQKFDKLFKVFQQYEKVNLVKPFENFDEAVTKVNKLATALDQVNAKLTNIKNENKDTLDSLSKMGGDSKPLIDIGSLFGGGGKGGAQGGPGAVAAASKDYTNHLDAMKGYLAEIRDALTEEEGGIKWTEEEKEAILDRK